MKKSALFQVIQLAYNNRDFYDAQSNKQSTSTMKQNQCPYRLLYMIFSDEFADEFLGIGGSPSRAKLDCEDAQNICGFWIRLQASFIQPCPIYDQMQFADDPLLLIEGINPGFDIQKHDWKNQWAMWMEINSW